MKTSLRLKILTLCFVVVATQLGSAQSADYFLERVSIHARLMQAKAPSPAALTAQDPFATDLATLISDLDRWKESFPAKKQRAYQGVRSGLEQHRQALSDSARLHQLTPEQATHCSLLLLELEQAAENIDGEYLRLATNTKDRRRRSRARFDIGIGPAWNAWGGPWGGWGAWGAGPYFGQPFGPGFGNGLGNAFGPRYW